MDSSQDITQLLGAWRNGDLGAEEPLMALIYPHLRKIAARRLPQDDRPFTLQTTELIHEAYLKLVDQRSAWNNRAHFFAVTARLMRRIVVDHARSRSRDKRGGGLEPVELDEALAGGSMPTLDWIDLDSALNELARIDGRAARVVELRYFGGLTVDEMAELLSIGTATVQRDWRFARSWLKNRMDGPAPEAP